MHAKNQFRLEIDFHELADKFPELKQYFETMNRGKRRLNFKKPDATRTLTRALLKTVYNVDVVLPQDRLVPTIPQKLNYVLWIDDLISSMVDVPQEVKGVDIGCGASCIYAFLGIGTFSSWTFVATEADLRSYECASENVKRNGLERKIEVVFNSDTAKTICEVVTTCEEKKKKNDNGGEKEEDVEEGIEKVGGVASFVMCNPPFFDIGFDSVPSRTSNRPPPKAPMTAAVHERQTEGGEIGFLNRMIVDSCKLGQRILWYTAMIGCKSHLTTILERLQRTEATYTVTTRFIQGKTHRWGVAWTFVSPNCFKTGDTVQQFLEGKTRYPYIVDEAALVEEELEHKKKLWAKRAAREGGGRISGQHSTTTSSSSSSVARTLEGKREHGGEKANGELEMKRAKTICQREEHLGAQKSIVMKKIKKQKLYEMDIEGTACKAGELFQLCRGALLHLAPSVQYTLSPPSSSKATTSSPQFKLSGKAEQNVWAPSTHQGRGVFTFTFALSNMPNGKVHASMTCTSGSRGDCHTLLLHLKGKMTSSSN
eukprot:m.72816 g.72816  ORF g.72816 m.72816 type:complete len:540 (+) comp8400_c0_seq2:64-1683(+)